eukprot:scaffold24291_cov69-Phaeocystis_antarctica.AAC.2
MSSPPSSRSSRDTPVPPASSTWCVRGNLKSPAGAASAGAAPHRRSSASDASNESSTTISSQPSAALGGTRTRAIARTAAPPRPYGIVGWSVRAAARRSHSAAGTSKKMHAVRASLGSIASSRMYARSAGSPLQRSRIRRVSPTLPSRPSWSSTTPREPASSWLMRTCLGLGLGLGLVVDPDLNPNLYY